MGKLEKSEGIIWEVPRSVLSELRMFQFMVLPVIDSSNDCINLVGYLISTQSVIATTIMIPQPREDLILYPKP